MLNTQSLTGEPSSACSQCVLGSKWSTCYWWLIHKERQLQCEISQVGKARNGTPRWWCTSHGAPATGPGGVQRERCDLAHVDLDQLHSLDLDPDQYEGGIGIWGAVEPVFNTTGYVEKSGVHVHARKSKGGPKEIDQTYDAVRIRAKTNFFDETAIVITREAAVAFYLSQFLDEEVDYLFCPHCGEIHLDEGYFATHPHSRHLCHSCGRYFQDRKRSISNPVGYFRLLHPAFQRTRKIQPAGKSIEIRQKDFPGGIEIWASNPALVWTAERSEQRGIHLHAYPEAGVPPEPNDTFDSVVIDGFELQYDQVAQLMAQNALPQLKGTVMSLRCPECKAAHFDSGLLGLTPHRMHLCQGCGTKFESPHKRKLVVSNPIVELFEQILRIGSET